MASLRKHSDRDLYRLKFRIRANGHTKTKTLYVGSKREADIRLGHALILEGASAAGMASEAEIRNWIEGRLLSPDEAELAFPAYHDHQEGLRRKGLIATDYQAVLDAYLETSARRSKGGIAGRAHAVNMSRARRIIAWLQVHAPNILQVDQELVEAFLDAQTVGDKTIWNMLCAFRAVLDEAVKLKMIRDNPARSVKRRQPKARKTRRILNRDEIAQVREGAGRNSGLIGGTLPVVVGLGLYLGMRDEEMVWARWDRLNEETRVYSIEETECALTGRGWYPKSGEARRVPVPPPLLELLQAERERQERHHRLGPFILSGKKPFHPDTPQSSWRKMMRRERERALKEGRAPLPEDVTIYCLRHTFATTALRPKEKGGLGLDIRTVQAMLGHQSVTTTMIYTRAIAPEEHPTDGLVY